MTIVVKTIIGLGTLAVGGAGTYLTYDYLSKKGNSATQTEDKHNPSKDTEEEHIEGQDDNQVRTKPNQA